jgi:hypothetical protein
MQNKREQPAASIGVRTISKVTLRIVPFIFLLFIVTYLDRTTLRSPRSR